MEDYGRQANGLNLTQIKEERPSRGRILSNSHVPAMLMPAKQIYGQPLSQ
jgi:hypothetical protein